MEKRTFLVFGFSESAVRVFTDDSGGYEFLAAVSYVDFTGKYSQHVGIMLEQTSENEKLHALSELWRDISPEIGGYLFGDTDESNPDPAIPCSECDCGQCS